MKRYLHDMGGEGKKDTMPLLNMMGDKKHVFKQLVCKSMSYIITYHN